MTISITDVKTEQASRYLQQLCKHWSHKMQTAFDPEKGSVDFPNGAKLLLSADDKNLHLSLETPDLETATRLEGVVAEHLKRFAFREDLEFNWQQNENRT